MRDSFFGMEASTIFIAFCSLLYLLMGKRLPRYEQRRTFLLLILDVLISAVFSFTFQIVLHSLHLRHYELRMTLMCLLRSPYLLTTAVLPLHSPNGRNSL